MSNFSPSLDKHFMAKQTFFGVCVIGYFNQG